MDPPMQYRVLSFVIWVIALDDMVPDLLVFTHLCWQVISILIV